MKTYTDKKPKDTSNTVTQHFSAVKSNPDTAFRSQKHHPGATTQGKVQQLANHGPKARQLLTYQDMATTSPQAEKTTQMQAMANNFAPPQSTGRKKDNNTGLPDNLKSGIENLSGHTMDEVTVHYNSDKPAQLNAHAYAQGTHIHLAPGQEKHLPHEAWHVVQQKQGRVKPTRQLKGKVNINDDPALEKEAEVMGAKASPMHQRTAAPHPTATAAKVPLLTIPALLPTSVIQGVFTLKLKKEEEGDREKEEEDDKTWEINKPGDSMVALKELGEFEALAKEFDEKTAEEAVKRADDYFLVEGEKTLDVVLPTFLVMVRRFCRESKPETPLVMEEIPIPNLFGDAKETGNMKEVQEALEGGKHIDDTISVLKDNPIYLKGLKLEDRQCMVLINKIHALKHPVTPQKKSSRIIELCHSVGKYHLEDEHKKTPLHLLTELGSLEAVQFMLGKDAKVDARTEDGKSPLHIAADKANTEICRLLLSHGANINATSLSETTPLHLAAGTKNRELCDLLIEHGAKLHAKDLGGESPTAKADHDVMKDLFNPLAERAAMKGQIAPLEKGEDPPSPAQIFESMIFIQQGTKDLNPKAWRGTFQKLAKNKSLGPLIAAIATLKKSGFKIIGSSGPNISNAVVTSGRGKMAEGWAPSSKTHPRIYFSAGGDHTNKSKRGTILHESTHHMMDLIFGNPVPDEAPAAPFFLDKEKERRETFEEIVADVEKRFGEGKKKKEEEDKEEKKEGEKSPETTPETIISSVFTNYMKPEWPGELIVRVPEILAAFPKNGEKWLMKHVPKLFAYWTDYVIPKLEKFEPQK